LKPGKSWNPTIVDELGAPDMLLQYLLQAPHRDRADVKTFMTGFREAFPDLSVTGTEDFVHAKLRVFGARLRHGLVLHQFNREPERKDMMCPEGVEPSTNSPMVTGVTAHLVTPGNSELFSPLHIGIVASLLSQVILVSLLQEA
jgi:hypothetical protein